MTGPGQQALDALDRALAARPHKADHEFAAAMDHLCILRDALIARVRAAGTDTDRHRLAHVNSVLTVVLGGYFPLGPIPWDEVAKARLWLQAVVHGMA